MSPTLDFDSFGTYLQAYARTAQGPTLHFHLLDMVPGLADTAADRTGRFWSVEHAGEQTSWCAGIYGPLAQEADAVFRIDGKPNV